MLPRSGRVPFLLPKPQYSFLNLSCEIVWQVNHVAISLFAIVRLIRSMWHLNERLLAFRLDNLYVRKCELNRRHSLLQDLEGNLAQVFEFLRPEYS